MSFVDHQRKESREVDWGKASKYLEGRDCGDCHACCVVYRIRDAKCKKPWFTRCSHLLEGKCDIYETRPGDCRVYFCCWRLFPVYGMPDGLRPDQSGAVVDVELSLGGGIGLFRVMETAKGGIAAFRCLPGVDRFLAEQLMRGNAIRFCRWGKPQGEILVQSSHTKRLLELHGFVKESRP